MTKSDTPASHPRLRHRRGDAGWHHRLATRGGSSAFVTQLAPSSAPSGLAFQVSSGRGHPTSTINAPPSHRVAPPFTVPHFHLLTVSPLHLLTVAPFDPAVEQPLGLDVSRRSKSVTERGTAVHRGQTCHRGSICDEEWHLGGDKERHRGGTEAAPMSSTAFHRRLEFRNVLGVSGIQHSPPVASRGLSAGSRGSPAVSRGSSAAWRGSSTAWRRSSAGSKG